MSNEKVTIQVSNPKPGKNARKKAKRQLEGQTRRKLQQQSPVAKLARNTSDIRKTMRRVSSQVSRVANPRVKAIVAYLADPLSNRPVLYCGPYANRKVAARAIHNVAAASYNTGTEIDTATQQLLPSTAFMAVFRDVRRSVVRYQPNYNTGWTMFPRVRVDGVDQGGGVPIKMDYDRFPDWSFATVTGGGGGGTNPPHGGFQWAGQHKGVNYFWVDGTADNPATVTCDGLSASTAYTVKIQRLFDGEVTFWTLARSTTAGGVLDFPLADGGGADNNSLSGYYTFTFKLSSEAAEESNPTNFEITGAADCFSHIQLPGLAAIQGSISQARVVALTAMYSNTAAPVNRQGKIATYQSPGSSCWEGYALYQNSNLSVYTELAPLQDATVWPADKGAFGFARPTQIEDFMLRDINQGDGTHMTADYIPYDICQQSDFLMITTDISDNNGGRDGVWVAVHAIEFVTSSQFIPMVMPSPDTLAHEQACAAMMRLDQWHENPSHFKDIMGFVKNLASPAVSLLNMGANIKTPLSPLFRTLAKGLGSL